MARCRWLLLLTLSLSQALGDDRFTGALATGVLPEADEIARLPADTLCWCISLCFARPRCASVSHAGHTCRLYRRVGSYASLLPSRAQHRLMPGRSQRRGFCHQADDCPPGGGRCLGRVCTSLPAVTCSVLLNVFRRTESGVYWGGVGNRTLRLLCDQQFSGGGWTLLVASGTQGGWNRTNALHRSADGEPSLRSAYSIYGLADTIIATHPESEHYEIDAYDVQSVRGGHFRVPRNTSLLRQIPGKQQLEGRMYGTWVLNRGFPVAPWLAWEMTSRKLISMHSSPKGLPRPGGIILQQPIGQSWQGNDVIAPSSVVLFLRESNQEELAAPLPNLLN